MTPALSKFTDETKLGENADLLEYRKGLQTVLEKLGLWVKARCRSFNEIKCRMLYFSPIHHCRLVGVLLESCPEEKDLRLLVNSQLNVSHLCFQMAICMLACIRNSVTSRTSEGIVPYIQHWKGCTSNLVSTRQTLRYWRVSREGQRI